MTLSQTSSPPPPIGGIYEICIGVTDAIPQIRYWQQFGYRIGPVGELTAQQAKSLYGVDSGLRSIRLLHQDSETGLIRLLVWDKPTNEGLGLAKMLAPGSRWTSTHTREVTNLWNHAEIAWRSGMPVLVHPPQWSVIYDLGKPEPFVGELIGVRELIVLQPLTRNMFFQRFGYDSKTYGKINEAAKFRTSAVTHCGLVFQGDDSEAAKFYSDVLGLQAMVLERKTTYESLDEGSRRVYDIRPGESYFGSTFDHPLSGKTPDTSLPGRLLLRRIPAAQKEENLMERSRPGSLGLSLYTYRVSGIEQFHTKVKASRATMVTEVLKNEFDEQSFSFRAPDGHSWMLVGK